MEVETAEEAKQISGPHPDVVYDASLMEVKLEEYRVLTGNLNEEDGCFTILQSPRRQTFL